MPDQFGLSCARVERVSPDERLNAARQVRHKIYKNALDQFGLSCARVESVTGLNAKSDNGGRFLAHVSPNSSPGRAFGCFQHVAMAAAILKIWQHSAG